MTSYGFSISPLIPRFPLLILHLQGHWYEVITGMNISFPLYVTVVDLFFLHKTLFPILATTVGYLLFLEKVFGFAWLFIFYLVLKKDIKWFIGMHKIQDLMTSLNDIKIKVIYTHILKNKKSNQNFFISPTFQRQML